jgi:FkbM family methyltransferase
MDAHENSRDGSPCLPAAAGESVPVNSPTPNPELSPAGFVEVAQKYERLWICGHLRELFTRLNVTGVWDVGANAGQYADLLRSFVRYDGTLLSFEPVGFMYKTLRERAKSDDRWRVFGIALGSSNGERAIKVARNPVLSSFLDRSAYSIQTLGGKTNVRGEEVVTVRTVDSIATEIMDGGADARVFMKLDTQGWDLEVLRGAEDLLSRVVGIQTEVSIKPLYEGMPHYTETFDYVQSKGFELSGVFPVLRDERLRLVELDCVFVRPEEISQSRSGVGADY